MRILLSAGEPSGDRLGAAVARALRSLASDVELEGVGGPHMSRAGVSLAHDLQGLGAVGVVEAARSLRHHLELLRSVGRQLERRQYDLVLPIDYPGFNMRLAARARRTGIPVLYFVAPQLWAWGSWRAGRLRRSVSKLASILPFEPAFFRAHDIPAEFVGHPVLDVADVRPKLDARSQLGLDGDHPVLAVFPGSRPAERRKLWPAFREAALRLVKENPACCVVIAGRRGELEPAAPQSFVFTASAALAASAADAGICKSGTVTLEAAMAGMPMVVAYRVDPWTAVVARRALRIPSVGLVNLVAGRPVVPELLQGDVTVERIVAAVWPLLQQPSREADRQRAAFEEVRSRLGGPGASERVAAMALDLAA